MRIHGTILGYVEILGYVPGRPCSAAAVAVRPRPVQKRPNRPSFRPWARVRTPSRKRTVPEWGGSNGTFCRHTPKVQLQWTKTKAAWNWLSRPVRPRPRPLQTSPRRPRHSKRPHRGLSPALCRGLRSPLGGLCQRACAGAKPCGLSLGHPHGTGVLPGPLPPSPADAERPTPAEMPAYCRAAQRRGQTGGTGRLHRGGPATGSLLMGPVHLYAKFAPPNRLQHGGRQALFFNYALKLHTEQIH